MNKYLTAGHFFCLRMPARPLGDILRLFNLEGDAPEEMRGYIRHLLCSDTLRAGIQNASPDLYDHVEKWRAGILPSGKEPRLLISLYKYISRASARSTPFGLLAGCTDGLISWKQSSLQYRQNVLQVNTRLDMACTVALADALARHPEFTDQLSYVSNNSICEIRGVYRFYKYELGITDSFYRQVEIAVSPLLQQVLIWTREFLPFPVLLERLSAQDLLPEVALRILTDLIDQQFLISEIYPQVTGKPFFEHLIEKINAANGMDEVVADMHELQKVVELAEATNVSNSRITNILQKYISDIPGNLLQKDLSFEPSEKLNLNKTLVDEVVTTCEELMGLYTPLSDVLGDFKQKFSARYGERQVPLLEALDPKYGIGYGQIKNIINEVAPVLKNLSITGKKKQGNFKWVAHHEYLLERIKTTGLKKEGITLTEADLLSLSGSRQQVKLPPGLCISGSFIAAGVEELDAGNYTFSLHHIGGATAGNLMSRFCGQNEVLSTALSQFLDDEQGQCDDLIFAEVVHLPEPRMGNVVMRPLLRPFEIPLVTRPGVPQEQVIRPDDLLITVRNDKIVLFSRKHSKEILPRLTTAHNFSHGMPLYHFLGDLQFQHCNFFSCWDWYPFHRLPYLPRVTYKKILLQRARWYLKRQDYKDWLRKNKGRNFRMFFEEQLLSYNVPELIVLKDGDNELLLNTKSDLSLCIIADHLKLHNAVLYEFIFAEDNCLLQRERMKFVHEVLLPVHSVMGKATGKKNTITGAEPVEPVIFMLGSEWLYFKIYVDFRSADEIIAEVIAPLCADLIASGTVEQWFFIRYKDPAQHIRLRFHHSVDKVFWKVVIEELNMRIAGYIARGIITKVVTDVYEPETVRYGVNAVSWMEKLFFTDSISAAGLLQLFPRHGAAEDRFFLSLQSIDFLLEDFGCGPETKYQVMNTLSAYFYQEHDTENDKSLKVSLDKKYRKDMRKVKQVMSCDCTIDHLPAYLDCLTARSEASKTLICGLKIILEKQSGAPSLTSLLSSLIHMAMNRLFAVNQRQHELVAYYYLSKYYLTQIARTGLCVKQ